MDTNTFERSVEVYENNPQYKARPALLRELRKAAERPDSWEFMGTSGGAANDSHRGFGATAQAWRNGNVTVEDDNCFPFLVTVRDSEGREWRPMSLCRGVTRDTCRSGWIPRYGEGSQDFSKYLKYPAA